MINKKLIDKFYDNMSPLYQERIDESVAKIVKAKQENEKIAIVTGSGPNIHEGVTTLIAELIQKGIIDGGILTSSAVIAHEMGGALDKVKRVPAKDLDFGGQETFRKQYLASPKLYFQDISLFYYVVDVQQYVTVQSSIMYFRGVYQKVKQFNDNTAIITAESKKKRKKRNK